jgi:exodeoxyribonuclease X
MPYGKHKGTPIKDIPADYIGWLLKQSDLDPYPRKALKG